MNHNYKLTDFKKPEFETDTDLMDINVTIFLRNPLELPSVLEKRLKGIVNNLISEYEHENNIVIPLEDMDLENCIEVNKKGDSLLLLVYIGFEGSELLHSNKIKREVCESIKKALRNRKVDDSTINRFEDVFWKETQGYSFSRRKTYSYDDFKLETDKRSLILDGEYGMKLQMSIFNPLVPTYYRDRALEVLNSFLSKHYMITVTSEDSLAAMLEAYIDEDVSIEKKYRVVVYLWNDKATEMEKGYVISDAILPTDEHFMEFEECVVGELRYMVFGYK